MIRLIRLASRKQDLLWPIAAPTNRTARLKSIDGESVQLVIDAFGDQCVMDRRKNTFLWLSLGVTLAVLTAALYVTFSYWRNLRETRQYHPVVTDFQSDIGIRRLMPVLKVGHEIGYVDEVSVARDGHVRAVLSIKGGHFVTDFQGVFLVTPAGDVEPYLIIDVLDPDTSSGANGTPTNHLPGSRADSQRTAHSEAMRKRAIHKNYKSI